MGFCLSLAANGKGEMPKNSNNGHISISNIKLNAKNAYAHVHISNKTIKTNQKCEIKARAQKRTPIAIKDRTHTHIFAQCFHRFVFVVFFELNDSIGYNLRLHVCVLCIGLIVSCLSSIRNRSTRKNANIYSVVYNKILKIFSVSLSVQFHSCRIGMPQKSIWLNGSVQAR